MTRTNEPSTTSERSVTRRTALRTAVAGTAAVVGGGPGVVNAAAQSVSITPVDLREDGPHQLPEADDLLVFVHGWYGTDEALEATQALAEALSDAGDEFDSSVALQWDAETLNYSAAEAETVHVGAELADCLRDYDDEVGGNVTLVGHSLGGRVVYETLRSLDGDVVVDRAAPMGTAADGSTVTAGGQWYDGIVESAAEVRNYHSRNDDAVAGGDGFFDVGYGGEDDTALGAEGAPADAEPPANYVDVDVTEHVEHHTDYVGNPGVAADLAGSEPEDDCAWYAFWCWLF